MSALGRRGHTRAQLLYCYYVYLRQVLNTVLMNTVLYTVYSVEAHALTNLTHISYSIYNPIITTTLLVLYRTVGSDSPAGSTCAAPSHARASPLSGGTVCKSRGVLGQQGRAAH